MWVDVIQLPAFLARQTDLVEAMAKTGAGLSMLKPHHVTPTVGISPKFAECGNNKAILARTGYCFRLVATSWLIRWYGDEGCLESG